MNCVNYEIGKGIRRRSTGLAWDDYTVQELHQRWKLPIHAIQDEKVKR